MGDEKKCNYKKFILPALILAVFVSLLIMYFSRLYTEAKWEIFEPETGAMFTEIEHTENWAVVYQNETRVMYAVSYDQDGGTGEFTLLVNQDGSPQTYPYPPIVLDNSGEQ